MNRIAYKAIVFVLGAVLGGWILTGEAWAQARLELVGPDGRAMERLDINRAMLRWTWAQGAGDGVAETFPVRCGNQSGMYDRMTPVPYPGVQDQYSVALRTVVGQGSWYCVVSAMNAYGESGYSNEIFFDAGAAPSTPSGFSVATRASTRTASDIQRQIEHLQRVLKAEAEPAKRKIKK